MNLKVSIFFKLIDCKKVLASFFRSLNSVPWRINYVIVIRLINYN